MTLEKFVEQLKKVYADDLQSIVLYGSAAAGDFQKGASDYNVMVVLNGLTPEHLAKGSKLIRLWMRQGNSAPLLIDRAHLENSQDAFPIEFSDMKEAHRILLGENPLAGLVVNREQLRLQCEREIKQKILTLRERYTALFPSKRRIRKLMLSSVSSFLAIFRGYLRLTNATVPKKKREVLTRLNEMTQFDTSVLEQILAAREGTFTIGRAQVFPLFAAYLTTLEKMATLIDRL